MARISGQSARPDASVANPCHTCISVIGIYGTNEYVVPWLCTCETKFESVYPQFTRQKTLSKGFGMIVDNPLTPRRYRYNKYHTPVWRSK